jgi:hypothetical protein
MNQTFTLPGGTHRGYILPVLAGVSFNAVARTTSASGRELQTVSVPLLSETAVCDIVFGMLGKADGRAVMQDPVFRWELMLSDGHPRSLRNLLLLRKYGDNLKSIGPFLETVDLCLVAKIQVRMAVDPVSADTLIARGFAAELPSPSRAKGLPAAEDDSDPTSKPFHLHIPAAFLQNVPGAADLGFPALRTAVENLHRSRTGENFEIVVAAALASRIRCLAVAGMPEISLSDLLGGKATFGVGPRSAKKTPQKRSETVGSADDIGVLSKLRYSLRGCEAIELVRIYGAVDEYLCQRTSKTPAVVYSGQQGATGPIDVAVMFADAQIIMLQCKLSDAATGCTLKPSVIQAELLKAADAAQTLRPDQIVPLVIVSQYPCSPGTLRNLKGPVAVVDRQALRRFIPRSFVGLVLGAFLGSQPRRTRSEVLGRTDRC